MGRRHASVVARQRRTENLDRIILPANDRLACNGPCDGVSGELYNPPDINELSLPFAFKVLVRERLGHPAPSRSRLVMLQDPWAANRDSGEFRYADLFASLKPAGRLRLREVRVGAGAGDGD